jgi:hypothetical protein
MDPTTACNEALIELKDRLIDSLDDGTTLANRCRLVYPEARDSVLELHPWDFATFRAALSRSDVTPAFTWTYQYVLPTGAGLAVPPYCLLVQGTDLDPGGPAWDVGNHPSDGRVLWSNEADVKIVYTGRVEDLTQWNALARQVLVKYLAAKLAATKTLAEAKLKEAFGMLPMVQRTDGRQGTPHVLQPNARLVWARQRTGGSGAAYVGIRTYLP